MFNHERGTIVNLFSYHAHVSMCIIQILLFISLTSDSYPFTAYSQAKQKICKNYISKEEADRSWTVQIGFETNLIFEISACDNGHFEILFSMNLVL